MTVDDSDTPTKTHYTPVVYPSVRITNDALPGYKTKIFLNDQDISPWCFEYRVGATVKEATILELKLFCGSLDVEEPMIGELGVTPVVEAMLIKHGWTPPVEDGDLC